MAIKLNLTVLHRKSNRNRSSLGNSAICGCFHCFKQFPFDKIAAWIDDDATALCPYCGVDAVLGFGSATADQELLHEMHDRWFKSAMRPTPAEWEEVVERNVWPPAGVRPPSRK